MRNNLPLLDKYERILKEDRSSLVFAPLAEIYRKSGDLKKAIQICLKGLKENPDYLSGRIVLANCYYEIEDFQQATNAISNFISSNLENILLQKLWGKINLAIGNKELALEVFQKLVFLFPGDIELKELIENLENELGDTSINIRDDEDRLIDIRNWEQKDIAKKSIEIEINDSTQLNFARLFNQMGDTESVNHLLNSIEESLNLADEAEINTSNENTSSYQTGENRLMDYFDLKASEIDLLLEENTDEENNIEINKHEFEAFKHIENNIFLEQEVKNSSQLNQFEEIESPSKNLKILNKHFTKEEFIYDVRIKCEEFLSLLVQRRTLAISH